MMRFLRVMEMLVLVFLVPFTVFVGLPFGLAALVGVLAGVR